MALDSGLALKHVHAKQIIHRDLKPGNVLVRDASVGAGLPSDCDIDDLRRSIGAGLSAVGDIKGPSVALADFGGACQLDVSATDKASFRLFGIGREATTYQYRAPELFVRKSLRANSYATDVWALGVCVAELAIGSSPFGPARMRMCQVEEVFVELLMGLYNADAKVFIEDIRKSHRKFFGKLKTLRVRGNQSLPWAKTTYAVVSQFLFLLFRPLCLMF